MAVTARVRALAAGPAGDRRHALGLALVLGLGLRVVLGLVASYSLKLYPSLPQVDAALQNQGLEPPPNTWQSVIAGPWQRWDALRYDDISVHGYNAQESAFPPLFPALQRALAPLFGGSVPVAGIAISTVSLVVGLYLLHRLVTTDLNPAAADRTVIYVTVFPTAFFFAANYPEALFLALSVATFLTARRHQFVAAGVLAAAAALCRPQGILLTVPLAMEVFSVARERHRAGDGWFDLRALAVALPVVVLAAWWIYVIVGLGVAGGPPGAEYRIWHDHPVFPLIVLWDDLRHIAHRAVGSDLQLVDLIVAALACASLPLMWRRLPRSYTVYAGLSVLVAISREVNGLPVAISRFMLVVFPVFAVAALAGRRPWVDRGITLLSPPLLVLATFHFVHWGYFG